MQVHYLLVKHNNKSAAIAILVVYFVLFLLMAASFFRLFYITIFDPPLVPLGSTAIRQRGSRSRDVKKSGSGNGIGGGEYNSRESSGDTLGNAARQQEDPDSPGLELFYTKDVFVCELDGKPKWCSHCANVRTHGLLLGTYQFRFLARGILTVRNYSGNLTVHITVV
jgi:palmitoyltransferase